MILLVPDENDDITAVAAQMVDLSIARKNSVNAVCQGVPLVTYPNDIRNREDRINLLELSFASSWPLPGVVMPPNEVYDHRFDPRFECEFCSLSVARETALKVLLKAVTDLLKKRFPDDPEIGGLITSIDTVVQSASFQQQIADRLAKRI